ncbi:MAG TPA: TonB family protein [Burkholderiales bacterium]|nr:TonB family protein [Burkholderiales bacterium]
MKSQTAALPWVSWPEPLARLDPESRALATALSISIVIHAIALSIHFRLPEALRGVTPSQLDVVLVNSKTRSRPTQADVLAQSNLDAGGDTELERRAKSPLPLLQNSERGADLKQATRKVQEMEARQRQLLSRLSSRQEIASAKPEPQAEVRAEVSGADLAESALIIARMEAQVARQIDDYNKRPRKTFVGTRAAEVRYALYVEDWRQKIERIGNLNYPEGARGRIYGSLRLTVSINADGTLAAMDLDQSSGYKILDAAAQQIVRLAAPYAKFPPDIRKETDILVITRTWYFARGDKVFSD